MNSTSFAKKVITYSIAISVWILIIEVGCRMWIERFGDPLSKTYRVIEPDTKLGWKLKSDLSTSFYDKVLVTNSNGYRTKNQLARIKGVSVLTLGPSSAFGWGVEQSETYSYILADYLKRESNKAYAEINTSQIGFSSLQGVKLAEQNNLKKLDPKVVLIAYGVNDLDRFRFFYPSQVSDAIEFSKKKSESENTLLKIFNSSAFFSMISRKVQEIKLLGNCETLTRIPALRVNIQEFKKNIQSLIDLYRAKDSKVFIVNTPVNYPDLEGKDLSMFHYERMAAAAKERKCQSANNELIKARSFEAIRISKDIELINKTLKDLSLVNDIKYIDAFSILGKDSKNFVDPIHPSAKGHLQIAKEIFKIME